VPRATLVYEWSELDRLTRGEVDRLKAFFARGVAWRQPKLTPRQVQARLQAAHKSDLVGAEVAPTKENFQWLRVVRVRPDFEPDFRFLTVDVRLLPAP
jgi:hypothetical protein